MEFSDYKTLIDPLFDHAAVLPDRTAITYMNDDGTVQTVSNADLLLKVKVAAQALSRSGIKPNDVVILVLPQSIDLISSFFGVIYLGALPTIFAFLTPRMDAGIYSERVKLLAGQVKARLVVTDEPFKHQLESLLSGLDCKVLSIHEIPSFDPNLLPLSTPSTWNDSAFLQFSSGTTGLQKGVAISHRAVLQHLQAINLLVNAQPDEKVASWLPLYHDMGLILGLFWPLLNGFPLILMSPFHWVAAPSILFQAMNNYKATRSWMPNFAFSHSTLNIRESDLVGIDLSHVRMLASGGEPVTYGVFRRFVDRFARYGFRPERFTVGYGLAEATLAVAVTPIGQPPHVDWIRQDEMQAGRLAVSVEPESPGSVAVISCGVPVPGVEFKVIDAQEQTVSDRTIGEVLVRGDFLFNQYYQHPELTDKIMHEGWVFTGDMGYLTGGQLYICGRKKDLIIIGGRNIYPEFIEEAILGIPEIRPGRTVVFGVPDVKLGTEMAVMVCEPVRTLSTDEAHQLVRELRRKVVQVTGVTLGDIRLVERGWIVKTSSGKISRSQNRQKYLNI